MMASRWCAASGAKANVSVDAGAPGFRAALYWAPDASDPLALAGNRWLGRDPETAAMLRQPDLPDIGDRTAAARLYGFHATLRPPMRLATGYAEFMAAAEACAAALTPFDLPTLHVAELDGFLALIPVEPSAALRALADACVRASDMHRLPPTDTEYARRLAAGLSAEQERLLARWGYPYVMQCWWFHMTLTDRHGTSLKAAAEAHFAYALAMPRRVEAICVFTQRSAGEPFLIAERIPLGRRPDCASDAQ
jgi:hypothetical protein